MHYYYLNLYAFCEKPIVQLCSLCLYEVFINHLSHLQVAKSIKIVMSARLASIVITLDIGMIQALRLHVDAYRVKQSILQTKKLKLKEQVKMPV